MAIVQQRVTSDPFATGLRMVDPPNTAALALAAQYEAAEQAQALAAAERAAAEQAAFQRTLKPSAPAPEATTPKAPAPTRKAPAPKRATPPRKAAAPPRPAPRPIRSARTIYEPRPDPVVMRGNGVRITADDMKRARRILMTIDEFGHAMEIF
ncbi:hypothetical protein [Micropruina sp.]|uniref:hypothetical protein n=1 Tax=Micropruina sp. TaxID=2737536 RepID=UPI0039E2C9AE